MEILIQGTKGGWKLLYPTALTSEAMYRFASDARRTDSKGNIRWQFYSIAFGGQGCVFSKYVGVRDVLRQFGGYVAFSVNIPNSKKMSGNDIKLLLDELAGRYCNDYVVNGNLGGEVHEDWTFVKAIESQYESRLRQVQFRDMVSEQSGSGEPSFIYYESDAELCKLLDSPYQDEYSPFKQVLLLERGYENSPESPLNAIRHDSQANLTGKIDFENPWYKLVLRQDVSNSSVDVEVRSNGKKKYNEDKIYRKEKLTITYSKRYSDSLVLEGKITDAELQPYLDIDEDNRRVIVKRNVDLKSASKKVVIVVTDLKGRPVEDVEVKVLTQGVNPMKKSSEADGSFVFVGEELGETFTVAASKDGLSGAKTFIPNQIEENVISLTIQKRKVISITVKDDNDGSVLYNCDIKVEDKKSRVEKKATTKDKSTYEFLGDEIDRNYLITISKYGYEAKTVDFCPEKENNTSVYYELKKKEKKVITNGSKQRYYLEVNPDKGSRGNCPDYIENVNERNDCYPKAKKGYRFVKWEDHRDQPYNQCDGHFIAIFEETWWHKHKGKVLLAAIAVILVALIVLVISLVRGKNPQPPKNEETFAHVKDSIEHCGNNLDMLSALQDRWQQQKPDIMKTGGFLGIIGGTPDSTMYKAWAKGMEEIEDAINKEKEKKNAAEKLRQEIKNYLEGNELFINKLTEYKSKLESDKSKLENDESLMKRLDSCIQLRSWLNTGKLDDIKSYNFQYSVQQQPIIDAINGIPSNAINYVKSAMKNAISTMTLDEIVTFIGNKIEEKKQKDTTTTNTTTTSTTNTTTTTTATTTTTTPTTGSNNQKQLEDNFWSLVHNKGSKNEFDELFGKPGWNKSSNIWGFYNKYLSWGTKREGNKKSGEENYNFYKGFDKVKKRDLESCNDINTLTQLVKRELGIQ